MPRIPRRRPSAALVISCCSLFVALGGTSYAVTTGSIGSREIRDGSIHGVDVANRTLTGRKLARDSIGGDSVKEQALDASKLGTVRRAELADVATRADNATAATTAGGVALQAVIAADGGRFHVRGVTDVVKTGTGVYQITFDRDVTDCVYAATLTYDFQVPGVPAGTGEIAAALGFDRDQLIVHTGDSAGQMADRPFHLLVSC